MNVVSRQGFSHLLSHVVAKDTANVGLEIRHHLLNVRSVGFTFRCQETIKLRDEQSEILL